MKNVKTFNEFINESNELINEGKDQQRLNHLRKFGIAPNNQPQNGAYIKSVSKPGKFFVDWKDAFKLGDIALEFIKSSGSESVFDIIDLKTMKRTGKQYSIKKGDLGNLRTTYGVRVSESINEAKFKEGQYVKSKNDSDKFAGDVYDRSNEVDGVEIPKGASFEIRKINGGETILWSDEDEVEYSIETDDLKHFVKESAVTEAYANKAGEFVMDHEPDPDTLLNIKATAKALGVKANDMKQIDSEMHYNSSEYSAVEKAFSKGNAKDIELPNASPNSGPFVYVNKRAEIAKYEEQGFTAYFFTNKSKF
jgi:hypothetical protein